VEISQHIKDLLLTHDRVILIDFGAFIAKYKPAKINDETGTMTPPGKEIFFDARIVKDGGLLAKHISASENISEQDAQLQIEEFVKTVKSKLNAGKQVKLVELGALTKIKDGIIMFTYEPSSNLLLDSYGLPKINLPKGTIVKSSKQTKTIGTSEKTNEKTNTKKSKGWIVWASIAAVIVILGVLVFFLKPQWINTSKQYVVNLFQKDTLNKSNELANIDSSDYNLKEKLNKDKNLKDKNLKDKNLKDKNSKDSLNQENNDKIKKDDKIITPPQNNKEKTNKSTGNYLSPEKGKAYLIVGSLPNAKTAEEEKLKFAQKGIDVSILPAGEDKYRLTLGIYSSGKEASDEYEKFHAKYSNVNVWLWENF